MPARAMKRSTSAVGLDADTIHAIATDPSGYQKRLDEFAAAKTVAEESAARAADRLAAAETAEAKSTEALQGLADRTEALDDRERAVVADESALTRVKSIG